MEKGIKTFQDDNSLFIDDNFYILDCDGNKIYFGLAKNKKDQNSNLYGPLQHITFTSENLDNFVDFYVNFHMFYIYVRECYCDHN